jgi:DNA-binding response OmpR family regulator
MYLIFNACALLFVDSPPAAPGLSARVVHGGDRKMSSRGIHPVLRNRRVLIVEDRFLVADELTRICRRQGGSIAGPVPDVAGARALAADEPLDLAILDVDLRGEDVFGVAAILERRGVPFLFVTGYGAAQLPEKYRGRPVVLKPFSEADLIERIGRVLHSDGRADPDHASG